MELPAPYSFVEETCPCGAAITYRGWDYQKHRNKILSMINGEREFIPKCQECYKVELIQVPVL